MEKLNEPMCDLEMHDTLWEAWIAVECFFDKQKNKSHVSPDAKALMAAQLAAARMIQSANV